jgi:hypothetical protein
MSYRMKITLPDPIMAQLEALAERRGEPASRIAAHMVCAGLAEGKDPRRDDSSISASSPATAPDRNAPWIEPVLGDPEWRSYMWGSIVALYDRDANERQHRGDARVGGRGRARTTGTLNDGSCRGRAAATCTGGVGFASVSR